MGLGETSSPPVVIRLGTREEVGGGGDWVGRGGASPVSSFLGPVGRTHAGTPDEGEGRGMEETRSTVGGVAMVGGDGVGSGRRGDGGGAI